MNHEGLSVLTTWIKSVPFYYYTNYRSDVNSDFSACTWLSSLPVKDAG